MYFSLLQGQGTSFCPSAERRAYAVDAGDDALFIVVNQFEDFDTDARHDAHVDDHVRGVGKLHANLRHGRADWPHAEGEHVHGASAHAAFEQFFQLPAHDVGIFPVVGGAGAILGK